MSQKRQFMILTQRYVEIFTRDRGNLSIILGAAVAIALLVPFLFPDPSFLEPFSISQYNVPGFSNGPRDPTYLPDNYIKIKQVIFFTVIAIIFYGVNNAIREVAKEVAIYKRERTVNLRILPYIGSKVVVLSMVCLLQVLVLEIVMAFTLRVPGAGLGFYLGLFFVLLAGCMAAMTMALACSAFMSNENKASSALPALIIPQFFLTGEFPPLTGVAALITNFGLTKWMFGILNALFQGWRVFPSRESIADPRILQALDTVRNNPDLDCNVIPCKQQALLQQVNAFIDRGKFAYPPADYGYLKYLLILLLFCVGFAALACLFQARKDRIKD